MKNSTLAGCYLFACPKSPALGSRPGAGSWKAGVAEKGHGNRNARDSTAIAQAEDFGRKDHQDRRRFIRWPKSDPTV